MSEAIDCDEYDKFDEVVIVSLDQSCKISNQNMSDCIEKDVFNSLVFFDNNGIDKLYN